MIFGMIGRKPVSSSPVVRLTRKSRLNCQRCDSSHSNSGGCGTNGSHSSGNPNKPRACKGVCGVVICSPSSASTVVTAALNAAKIPMRSLPLVVQLIEVVTSLCTTDTMLFDMAMRPEEIEPPDGIVKAPLAAHPEVLVPSPTAYSRMSLAFVVVREPLPSDVALAEPEEITLVSKGEEGSAP